MQDEYVPPGYKKCIGCGAVYCETLFPMKNGHRVTRCDKCFKVYNRKIAQRHPAKKLERETLEARKAQRAQWAKDNPDKIREYNERQDVISGRRK